MVVVGKSESCYLLCGWLGSDLKGVFSVFLQGVGDTSDSESWFAEGEGPSWVFVELEFCFLCCGQQVPLRSKVRENMDVVWK